MRYIRIKNLSKFKIQNFTMSIQYALFIGMFFLKAYGDALLANNQSLGLADDLKYIFLIAATILSLIQIVKYGVLKNIFVTDLKQYILLLATWLIITLITINNSNAPMTQSIKYWIYIILPFIYAYCTINTLTPEMLEKYFKTALIICMGCYVFVEMGLHMFSQSNIQLISFIQSASPFESSYSAGTAIGLCSYFAYNRKHNQLWLYASMIFCFLTFKRLSIVMMFVFFIVPMVFNKDKVIKTRWIVMRGIVFIGATIFEKFAFHPKYYGTFNIAFSNLFGIEADKIFMGRVRFYNILINSEYKIAGLGSTLDAMNTLIGKSSGMELELLQLLMEVGILGLILFIVFSYKLSRGNLYCLVIIDFILLNMLTSFSLGSPFGFILNYLIIWGIHKKLSDIDNDKECEHGKILYNNSCI